MARIVYDYQPMEVPGRDPAGAYGPFWVLPQAQPLPLQAAPPPPESKPALVMPPWAGRAARLLLLLICALAGGLLLISALGLWPPVDAAGLGLDDWQTFLLLAGGGYLLAMVLYTAWRTRWLGDLEAAPGDARLAACACIAAGALVVLAAVTAVVVVVAALFVASVLAGLVLRALWALVTSADRSYQSEGSQLV
jgi:hypothetical protein